MKTNLILAISCLFFTLGCGSSKASNRVDSPEDKKQEKLFQSCEETDFSSRLVTFFPFDGTSDFVYSIFSMDSFNSKVNMAVWQSKSVCIRDTEYLVKRGEFELPILTQNNKSTSKNQYFVRQDDQLFLVGDQLEDKVNGTKTMPICSGVTNGLCSFKVSLKNDSTIAIDLNYNDLHLVNETKQLGQPQNIPFFDLGE